MWKRELRRKFGIVFDHLYTITNMPISRFLEFLQEKGRTAEYMARLVSAFNPGAAAGGAGAHLVGLHVDAVALALFQQLRGVESERSFLRAPSIRNCRPNVVLPAPGSPSIR